MRSIIIHGSQSLRVPIKRAFKQGAHILSYAWDENRQLMFLVDSTDVAVDMQVPRI